MTEKNKRINIREEMERADKAMAAAHLLFDNDFFNDAVSKLYYFLLYNIRALLLTKGLEPKSHEGVLRLLGLHFIKQGIFEAEASHIFAKLMKYREEADYNPSYIFTKEDFIDYQRETRKLSNKIRAYLNEAGYL